VNRGRAAGRARFAKFNAIGLLGAGFQVLLTEVLVRCFHIGEAAAPAAVEAALLHNFFWHERFTWSDRGCGSVRRSVIRLLRFHAGNGLVSIAGNTLLMYVLREKLQLPALPSAVVAIALCAPANFLLAEQWVYNDVSGRQKQAAGPESSHTASTLPARLTTFRAGSMLRRSRKAAAQENMLHVLLIEDSPPDVLLVREGVRRSPVPADLVVASDGEQGLDLLSRSRFDLVILDLNVPKVRGHAVLDRRRLEAGPPVVVFTGSDNPTDREIALAFGAKDYVVKPREFIAFMQAVNGILEKSLPARAAAQSHPA